MNDEKIPRLLVVQRTSADIYIFDYYLYPHFEVYAAISGDEALKLLKEVNFDCILVDTELDDCEASDLIETIQTHFGPVPAILLTSIDEEGGRPIMPVTGVSTCLNKDLVTNQELLESIWDVLEHSPVFCSMIQPK